MKPLKDIDLVVRAQYLKIFAWCFFPFTFIGGALFGYVGIFIGVLLSLVIPVPILFILDRIGGFASLLYRGRRANWSQHEQLEGDLTQVKYLKMIKNYATALELLDTILNHDPNHPEALFIKAQILWEGFENYAGAKVCLKKVIDMESIKDDPIRRWASNLSDEITFQMKKSTDKQ
ncbi:MAG: tetratricopeptide repeat protein [Pseudomonadota bacterium]